MENFLKHATQIAEKISEMSWGWPTIIFFIATGLIATCYLRFVQFRYFFTSWKLALFGTGKAETEKGQMTSFQAFLNALSTSMGNGSLAGMAVAVHTGGPGAAFWIFVVGIFSLAIRYCEVYLSTAYKHSGSESELSSGPMIYLQQAPGGIILSHVYAFSCLMMACVTGNGMQSNSVATGIQKIIAEITKTNEVSGSYKMAIAFAIFSFVLYVVLGGSKRIVKISEKIMPFKVGLFFLSTYALIFYHFKAIPDALMTIIKGAFTPTALTGALIGVGIQQAIKAGLSKSINASEVGLGSAGIFFGASGTKDPVENGLMSMVSAFISNYLVCFVICLAIVLSGHWTNPDLNGIALTTEAFATLYGASAKFIITLLTIIFGIGVLVPYAFVGAQCWSFLTKGKFKMVFFMLYPLFSLIGATAKIDLVWASVDIINAFLVATNLYAILILLKNIRYNFIKNNA